MAYPASTKRLEDSLRAVDATALNVKGVISKLVIKSNAGPVNRLEFVSLVQLLSGAVNVWNDSAALPGMAQYAKDQKGDQSLDVAVEFVAMMNATIALRDWIVSVFPTDAASGAWLEHGYDNTGQVTPLMFSSSALAGFRSRAGALVATIG